MKMDLRIKSLILWVVFIFPCPVSAQQSISPTLDASRIEERLSGEIKDFSEQSRIDIPLLHEKTPRQLLPEDTSGITFTVSRIIIEGSTIFEDQDIADILQQAIGDDVTFSDLKNVAISLTNLYREHGYVFSLAFVPKQTLHEETVKIQVIEGYIDDIEYRGIDVSAKSQIVHYAEKIKKHVPLRQDTLERYILLINDLYGIKAQALISLVEDKPGAVKLILLLDQHHNELASLLNNRGSYALGPLQSTTVYGANDFFGANEQTKFIFLSSVGSNELHYFSIGQSWPIGPEGTRLSYSFRRSDSNPGKEAKAFDIESGSNSLSFEVFHPWIRSRATNLSTALKFETRNSTTESFDGEIIDDHLRYSRLNGKYNHIHDQGITEVSVTVSKGLDIFNASPDDSLETSRVGAKATSSKIQGSVKRQQILNDNWSINAKIEGQMAFSTLLSAELFGVGGNEYARAFDFSSITGDHGYSGYLELVYAIHHNLPNVNKLNLYGVIDGGRTYDKTQPSNENWQGLSSAGIGVDTSVYGLVNAKLEVSKPLWTDTERTQNERNLFFTLGFKSTF